MKFSQSQSTAHRRARPQYPQYSTPPPAGCAQLLDNQPRRTRRLRPARLLLPSVAINSASVQPASFGSRAVRNEIPLLFHGLLDIWLPPVRRSRRHRPPPFGLPGRAGLFVRVPLLPGQLFFSDLPAFLSFSRGFLLIHRAAWAVCRSGLWNPAPGGRLRGPACGCSGPWPVHAAFPRWQSQITLS